MTSTTTAPPETQPDPVEAGDDRGGRKRPSGPTRPWWGRWAQLSVAVFAGAAYLSNLTVNGLGNPYYAAAVKSGSVSWKAFFFGSIDPASFITVDKPPAAFWLQALSARVFGYSSWSILAPEAVAGIIAAAIAYHLARRMLLAAGASRNARMLGSLGVRVAEVAGVLAGLALAVTPIAAVMFRFNDPDALLALFLLLASWAGWVAVERGSIRHLVLAGFSVGMAFLCKELVAAVVVPGLALAWIVAAPLSWRRRLWGWLWSGLMLALSAGWWVAVVQLWPASDRPYIASSSDNSIITVIFGYNGFSRLFGSHRSGHGASTHAASTHAAGSQAATERAAGFAGHAFGGGGGLGGGAGWTRMFSSTLGSQISWLLPLAAVGLVFGLLSAGRSPRTDLRRAGYILWGGWAATAFVVFSKSTGTFHSYYVVALAPPVALLAAVGSVELWVVGRRHRSLSWLLPLSVAGSGVWAWKLLDREASYHPWLRTGVLVVSVVGAVGLLVAAFAGPHSTGTPADLTEPAADPTGTPADPTADRTTNPTGPPADATGARAVTWGGGRRSLRTLGAMAAVVAAVALLAGPTAWVLSSDASARNGTNPTAGPSSAAGTAGFGRAGGGAGETSGATAGDKSFVKWLEANRDGAEYLVAVDGSMSADDLIIASGKPVMDMGGFSGTDPYPTLSEFQKLVSDGKVRHLLVSSRGSGRSGGAGATGFGGGGGDSPVSAVLTWAEAHGSEIPTSKWGGGVSGTLYELTPATVKTSS